MWKSEDWRGICEKSATRSVSWRVCKDIVWNSAGQRTIAQPCPQFQDFRRRCLADDPTDNQSTCLTAFVHFHWIFSLSRRTFVLSSNIWFVCLSVWRQWDRCGSVCVWMLWFGGPWSSFVVLVVCPSLKKSSPSLFFKWLTDSISPTSFFPFRCLWRHVIHLNP